MPDLNAQRPPGLVKISQLARAAGVPVSTVKHYVRVGLLPPPARRPNHKMAWYDEGLVDRIRAIRILQRERFLPLETIAGILGPPPGPGERRREALRAEQLIALEPAVTAPSARAWTREETLASLPHLEARDLRALARAGLVSTGGRYADDEVEILKVVNDTRAAGLGHVFPLEVLGPYVDAVRRLVGLEIDLFRHCLVASGVRAAPALDDAATSAARLGERLVVALRRRLIPSELRRIAADAATPRPLRRKRTGGRR